MLKKITKNTSLLSLGAGLSLFLGFIRNILIARFFGTSAILEAFIVAFRIPNLFRSIFAEGFGDSVATPILSEYQDRRQELFSIGNNLFSLLIVVLSAFTLVGIIFAKYLVMILAPGFIDDPEKFAIAVSFTRITFLYLIFMGLSVNCFSLLSALKRFFVPAITPAFLNVSFIAGIIFFNRFFSQYILVACAIGGGVLQLLLPAIALCREGFKFRLRLRHFFEDKAVRRMIRLFPPRIISSVVYQLNVMIDTILASFSQIVGEGAMAALWFANNFIHMPLALIVYPISRVAIVDFSYFHINGKHSDFKKLLVFSFQNIIFFVIPISFIYIFLSRPIIDVVLQGKAFTAYSSAITASVLFFYSFGLFFFCGIKLLVNIFYAIKDTATPAKVASLSLLINVVASLVLMFPLKAGGLALGTTIAAMVNFIVLYKLLLKKIGAVEWGNTFSQFIKVFVLSLMIMGGSRLLWDVLAFHKYVKAAIVGGSAAIAFAGLGYVLGLRQIRYIREWISKRK
jgi:putative peptidoglycan lipid II flippase